MKRTLSSGLLSDRRIERAAADSAFLCAALILSYLESLFPVMTALPLPGFKPGLANAAICACAIRYSAKDAFAVNLGRLAVTLLLFGSWSTALFSLFGGALSCLALWVFTQEKIAPRFSFFGISVGCAVAHNGGQLLAAVILMGDAVLYYTPALLFASLLYGCVNGMLLTLLPDVIYKKGR